MVGSSEVQILECKTAGIHGARLWKDGVPEYVQLQVMHQLAVTGHKAADVAVLIGGQELRIFRIDRDEALIARLIEMEHAFWHLVESNTPPAGDGSDSAEKALRCLYPNSVGEDVDMSEDPQLNATFEALLLAREQLDAAQKKEARLRQAIQIHMGEAGKATFACGGSVTWRRSKDGQAFDTAQFVKDHPELSKAFNSIRTLVARLRYFAAVSGGHLAAMPLEMRLRGKSTTQSHRAAIYYADLVVRTGLSLNEAIGQAKALAAQRQSAGFAQSALDEAARLGYANGSFEDAPEEAADIVEELYPEDTEPPTHHP